MSRNRKDGKRGGAPDTKPDERLAEIRERLAKATPGPWHWVHGEGSDMGGFANERHESVCDFGDAEQYYPTEGCPPSDEDAEFIAHAPEDIAYLLSRVSSSPPEGEDTTAMDFLASNCCAITLRYSDGEEREFDRDYFSSDDDFREFMRQLPAEYERIIDSARAAIPPQDTGHE